MRVMLVVCTAVGALAAVGMSPAADACGMKGGSGRLTESPFLVVDRAALDLDEAKAHAALRRLDTVLHNPRVELPSALQNRAKRLRARAITLAGHESPLGDAIADLEALLEHDEDDPQVLTDLGVALARRHADRARAADILEKLAARDLLTSAHGWATLASLRSDATKKAVAMRRCRLMTQHAAAVCVELEPGLASPS